MREEKIAELLSPQWKITNTSTDQTGIRLFHVEHPSEYFPTSVWIAEPNKDFDYTAGSAWTAAKTSRSQQSYDDAFAELNKAMRINPGEAAGKLANVFENYGHDSVGDMANIFIFMNEIPIYQAYEIFNMISVGAGQETSTRYIEFDDLNIDKPELLLPLENLPDSDRNEIEQRWDCAQERLKDNYNNWFERALEAYKEKFPNVKESTLKARVFDISRQWIPMGTKTSMSLVTSVRNWIDIVKKLRESTDISNKLLGEQIMAALSLSNTQEAKDFNMQLGSLIKHSTPTETIPHNLGTLKEYMDKLPYFTDNKDLLTSRHTADVNNTSVEYHNVDPDLGMALQYILSLYPELDEKPLIEWLNNLNDEHKSAIGEIIFQDHDNHNQLSNRGDIRAGGIFEIISAISYLRDFNRHKATGRFTDLFGANNALALLRHGFNLNHQVFNTKGFEHLRELWEQDAKAFVNELRDFAQKIDQHFPDSDSRWLLRILPMGINSRLHMSAPLIQLFYLTNLRKKRGGDLGYVYIAQLMIGYLKKMPFLRNVFQKSIPLDLESREEFQTRS